MTIHSEPQHPPVGDTLNWNKMYAYVSPQLACLSYQFNPAYQRREGNTTAPITLFTKPHFPMTLLSNYIDYRRWEEGYLLSMSIHLSLKCRNVYNDTNPPIVLSVDVQAADRSVWDTLDLVDIQVLLLVEPSIVSAEHGQVPLLLEKPMRIIMQSINTSKK